MSRNKSGVRPTRDIGRNIAWSFFGMVTPLLAGVFAIPVLIAGMGKDRFGLLTLIWMGVGYFSLLDLGIGRALAKLVSVRIALRDTEDLSELLWTALWLVTGLGLLGAVTIYLLASPMITHILNIPLGLQDEGENAFRVLAAGIPFVVLTSALRGLLEAHNRFALITVIRIPLGVMTFLGPVATLYYSPSLVYATVALLAMRGLGVLAYLLSAFRVQPELVDVTPPSRQHVAELINFGGWVTVSNAIGPVLTYFDRFVLGSLRTMTAVTYYVTPYEIMSRLEIMPTAVMQVLFPVMSAAQASDAKRMLRLYDRTARGIFVLTILPVSACFLFAPEALSLWLGPGFSTHSAVVVRWLALGWFVNSMARPAHTALLSAGRPDLVAKVHAAEVIPYLVVLFAMTTWFGISGTAATWFARVLIDTLVLNVLARRVIPSLCLVVRRTGWEIAFALICAGAGCLFLNSLLARVVIFVVLLAATSVGARSVFRNGLE